MASASVICKVENSMLTRVIDHLQNKITGGRGVMQNE